MNIKKDILMINCVPLFVLVVSNTWWRSQSLWSAEAVMATGVGPAACGWSTRITDIKPTRMIFKCWIYWSDLRRGESM